MCLFNSQKYLKYQHGLQVGGEKVLYSLFLFGVFCKNGVLQKDFWQ